MKEKKALALPEQDDESVDFQQHSHDGPSQEDDDDATEEGQGAPGLLPLEEESEGAIQTDC